MNLQLDLLPLLGGPFDQSDRYSVRSRVARLPMHDLDSDLVMYPTSRFRGDISQRYFRFF
jgi:hypothetical protein